jgi:hypothetical protein
VRRLLVLAVLALLSCREQARDLPAWPPGLLISAETPAFARFLEALAQLERTPLARIAGALHARLPECPQLEAQSQDGDFEALLSGLRCADLAGPLAKLHQERGAHALAFVLPGADGARAFATADLDGAAARIALRWPGAEQALGGFAPGDAAAGPDRLARDARVAHATLLGAGPLDFARWVPEGSQGDRLFRLRSDLFGAALLDGRIELALYAPLEQAAMPRAALALGVRSRAAAEAAAARFLAELESAWALRRTPYAAAGAEGACLPDLHLLPELAPCYALTDGALVVGWNASSLNHAIGTEASAGPDGTVAGGASARFDLDLAAVSAADARLAAARGVAGEPQRWPWRRVRAAASRSGGELTIEIDLEPERTS